MFGSRLLDSIFSFLFSRSILFSFLPPFSPKELVRKIRQISFPHLSISYHNISQSISSFFISWIEHRNLSTSLNLTISLGEKTRRLPKWRSWKTSFMCDSGLMKALSYFGQELSQITPLENCHNGDLCYCGALETILLTPEKTFLWVGFVCIWSSYVCVCIIFSSHLYTTLRYRMAVYIPHK